MLAPEVRVGVICGDDIVGFPYTWVGAGEVILGLFTITVKSGLFPRPGMGEEELGAGGFTALPGDDRCWWA